MRVRSPAEAKRIADGSGEAGSGLVEVLVSVTILAFGLLAVAGLTWTVGRQTLRATVLTDQTLAAQQVLDGMVGRGFDALAAGTGDTAVLVGERSYPVTRRVTRVGAELKELAATVDGRDGIGPRTFTTRLHRERALP